MKAQSLFHEKVLGLATSNVYFESTRAEKLVRIAALDCSHFIDDLEEVLDDPGFPQGVRRILFTDGSPPVKSLPYPACMNWQQIAEAVFDERL
jgi:hypothetical protein